MNELNPRTAPGPANPQPGHNRPDFQKQETDRLAVDFVDLGTTVTEILAKAREEVPEEITTEAELGIVNKFVVDMRDIAKRVETFRTTEKEPHLRRGDAVDQFFKSISLRLTKAMEVIGARGHAFNQKKLAAERERREAEAREAARLAREAQAKVEAERRARLEAEEKAARARKQANVEEHQREADRAAAAEAGAREAASAAAAAATDAASAAAVKPAEIARSRTDEGYLSTMKQIPYVELVDASKLNKDLIWPFLKEEAILAALKAYAKTTNHKRPMEGAIIEMRDGTVYR